MRTSMITGLRSPTALLAVALAGTVAHAAGSQWTIDPAHSAIRVSGTQFGRPFQGGFARFGGRIVFEPGPRPTGSVRIAIDVASLGTGDGDRDAQARGPAWFAAATAPRAIFAADRFRRLSPDRYVADGVLTIRGNARPASLPFALAIAGDRATMRGAIRLDRLGFGLGTGVPEATVGREVAVSVVVAATRAPKRS